MKRRGDVIPWPFFETLLILGLDFERIPPRPLFAKCDSLPLTPPPSAPDQTTRHPITEVQCHVMLHDTSFNAYHTACITVPMMTRDSRLQLPSRCMIVSRNLSLTAVFVAWEWQTLRIFPSTTLLMGYQNKVDRWKIRVARRSCFATASDLTTSNPAFEPFLIGSFRMED